MRTRELLRDAGMVASLLVAIAAFWSQAQSDVRAEIAEVSRRTEANSVAIGRLEGRLEK
jgi:hypothetical protein